jgi:hypothetical protein
MSDATFSPMMNPCVIQNAPTVQEFFAPIDRQLEDRRQMIALDRYLFAKDDYRRAIIHDELVEPARAGKLPLSKLPGDDVGVKFVEPPPRLSVFSRHDDDFGMTFVPEPIAPPVVENFPVVSLPEPRPIRSLTLFKSVYHVDDEVW